MKQLRLRAITLQGPIDKILMLLSRLRCEVTVKITQNPQLILCSICIRDCKNVKIISKNDYSRQLQAFKKNKKKQL